MERPENQTPENLKKADAFYLNDEDAMFSPGAWNYGSDIRGNVGLGRIGSLAGADTATKKSWKELEEALALVFTRVKDLHKDIHEDMFGDETGDEDR